MERFAGYIRVSRVGDRATTLISPELQEAEIRKWAKTRGVDPEILEPELDQSGAKDERPILQAAIARIEMGDLDGIVVWKFARFTRTLASSLRFLEVIEGVGGQLHSTAEPLDPTTPSGRMTRNFFFSIAQAEREEAAEGFEKSKASAIAKAIWTAPHVPFGFVKNADRRLEPHPIEGPVRAEIIRMRAAGTATWRQIQEHVVARTGRSFTNSTVRDMVLSRLNIGETRQGDHVNPKGVDPIIDRPTWEAARTKQARRARNPDIEPALLAEIARCAGCCFSISHRVVNGKRKGECRRHHRTGDCLEPAISNEEVEAYVVATLFEHARNIAYTASDRSAALEEAEGVVEAAEAELKLYQETVRVSDVGAEHFEAGMRSRAKAVDNARRALAAARLAAPRVLPGTLEQTWPDLTVAERRQVLRGSFSVVWVRGNTQSGLAVPDRVRLVAAGFEPDWLSRRGRTGRPIATLDWNGDLEGEVRVPGLEYGPEAAGGATL